MTIFRILFFVAWIVSIFYDFKIEKMVKRLPINDCRFAFTIFFGWLITMFSFIPVVIALTTADEYVTQVIIYLGWPLFLKIIYDIIMTIYLHAIAG